MRRDPDDFDVVVIWWDDGLHGRRQMAVYRKDLCAPAAAP